MTSDLKMHDQQMHERQINPKDQRLLSVCMEGPEARTHSIRHAHTRMLMCRPQSSTSTSLDALGTCKTSYPPYLADTRCESAQQSLWRQMLPCILWPHASIYCGSVLLDRR